MTIAAAARARWRAPIQTVVSSCSASRSVTTTKSHGWRFDADGDLQPASTMRSRSAAGMARSSYMRTLRRARMASHVSMGQTLRRVRSVNLVFDRSFELQRHAPPQVAQPEVGPEEDREGAEGNEDCDDRRHRRRVGRAVQALFGVEDGRDEQEDPDSPD